jgi:hypothetical protein
MPSIQGGVRRHRQIARADIVKRVAFGEALRQCRAPDLGGKVSQSKVIAEFARSGVLLRADALSEWERAKSMPHHKHMPLLRSMFPDLDGAFAAALSSVSKRAESEEALKRSGADLIAFLRVGESGQIDGGERWIKTNHSDPVNTFTTLAPGDPEFGMVARVVREHYPHVLRETALVLRIDHALDGRVFCVGEQDGGPPTLVLKFVHSRREPSQMRNLRRAQDVMAAHNVFRGYSRYHIAIKTKSGDTWIDREDGGPISAFLAMPELNRGEATHFQGETLDEIEDVGEKFGQVNNILVHARVSNTDGFRKYSIDASRWEETVKLIQPAAAKESPALRLALDHKRFIRGTLDQLLNLVEPNRAHVGRHPVSLSDLHPRNVFTMGGKCILIYDFEEANTKHPEGANLAFSAHRFGREYIRKKRAAGDDPRAAAHEAALAFLRGYRTARPPKVIEEAVADGIDWAKALNFAKLVTNLEYELKRLDDPIGRRDHCEEIRKFLCYLRELDELKKWDWFALVRSELLSRTARSG